MAFIAAAPLTSTHKSSRARCTHTRRARSFKPSVRATLEAPSAAAAPAATEWPDAAEISKGSTAPTPTPALDVNEVMTLLPHRFPFLLVDRVLHIEAGKRGIGIKAVTVNEPFFPGHFPTRPIMPGVLQIEALAQLSGIVLLKEYAEEVDDFFFGGVDGVRWRKPVVPGDTLVMEATCKSFKKRFGIAKFEAKAYVDGQLVVEANLTLAMVTGK